MVIPRRSAELIKNDLLLRAGDTFMLFADSHRVSFLRSVTLEEPPYESQTFSNNSL